MILRFCNKCGVQLAPENMLGGKKLVYVCRPCHARRIAAVRTADPDYARKSAREWRARNPDKVKAYRERIKAQKQTNPHNNPGDK
ncbi:hypothetical protein [Brevundimonas sp.]|uniref:hypothetical protein n=1 Tax=Brevundimonas sp. TaxID=1871086 RepID=UPI0035B1064E